MKNSLEHVSTESLVEELKKRFAAVERAKSLLFGADKLSRTRHHAAVSHVPSAKRKRGGTSEYARQVSTLVQKIRHAKGRGENVSALEKRLNRIRAQHGKE